MSIHVPENFYRQTITRAVTLTGATNIYVSAHPSPSEGYVTISPASATLREIVYYTAKGTDGNGIYITVTLANRGLGGTTAQTHAIGEPVRMNVSAETIQEISDALDQIVAAGAQDASTTVKGIVKLNVAPDSASNPIALGVNGGIATSTGVSDAGKVPKLDSTGRLDRSLLYSTLKFGGDGSDGALTVSSGTTTIDLGSSAFVVKNYSSISITGTGVVAFSNPHTNGTVVILKCQGDVTLTSSATPMLDGSGLGGANGSGGQRSTSGGNTLGSDGANGITPTLTTDAGEGDSPTNAGGVAPTSYTFSLSLADTILYTQKYPKMWLGSGGGGGQGIYTSGSGGSITGGYGGRGGGCLIMECAGYWNFTTTNGISVAGKDGSVGVLVAGPSSYAAGGGGGGGGGFFMGLYNYLTANTGTITVTGGTGAVTLASGAYTAHGGGGGASAINNGSAGNSSATNGVQSGGNGGAGSSLVIKNTEFV